jgi:hypothetical protein
MTERPTRPARAGRPGWTAAISGTLALFAVLVLLLGVQMRAGRDPVLGAAAPAGSGAATTARPAVVVRRIITRRVIRVVQGDTAATPAPVRTDAPVVTRSATPAPTPPAPAPAPAPAPLTTRSS